MGKYLHRFEDKIHDYAKRGKDIISQVILLWNCIYHVVTIFIKEHPYPIFSKHENLSRDPIGE
jgi:hypothetical protein